MFLLSQKLPTKNFLQQINNSTKFVYTYVETENSISCNNCVVKYLQLNNILERNTLLETFMNSRILSINRFWNYNCPVIVDNSYILSRLLRFDTSQDRVSYALNKRVIVHTCDIENYDTLKVYKQKVTSVKGANLKNICDEEPYKSHAISLPEDSNIGLIRFNRNNNFLLIDNSNFETNDVIEISKKESQSIIQHDTGGRSGAASGIVYPETNSHSLSSVTQKDNSFLLPQKNSIGLKCIYENAKGEIKSFSGVYNDILMNRIGHSKKKKFLLTCPVYRRIMLKEMVSRIQSYLVVYHFSLFENMALNPFDKLNDILAQKPTYVIT